MPPPNPVHSCIVLITSPEVFDATIENAASELFKRGYPVWRARDVQGAHEQMAEDALSAGFNELMMIHPSIVFHPDSVDRFRAHRLPIVCGIPPVPGRRALACDFLPNTSCIRFGQNGDLIEVLSCGLWFTMIRREAFAAIRQRQGAQPGDRVRYFALPANQERASNDLDVGRSFCARAREASVRVVADTTVRLWRIGLYWYGWEDAGSDKERFQDYTFNLGAASPPTAAAEPPSQAPAAPPLYSALRPVPPRSPLRRETRALPAGFPKMRAYIPTYAANRDSLLAMLGDFRLSDWGEEPMVFDQPADWATGRESGSRNFRRTLERAVADGCDFALILEDDVRVNRRLRHNLNAIPLIRRDQCDYFSLFMPDLIDQPWERHEPHLGYRLARPLYAGPNQGWERFRLWGAQGYLLSRRFLLAALERWDRLQEGQDTRVLAVCAEFGLSLYYSAPCLVEHVPLRSAFNTPTAHAPDFDADFRLEVGAGFQPPEEVPGWVSIEECRLLQEKAGGLRVLELGTCGGRSTVSLAQGAERVVSVDAVDQSEAMEWVRRYGLASRVEFRLGDVEEACQGLTEKFGMGFVNCGYDAGSVRRDINVLLQRVSANGLLAFHHYPDPQWSYVRRVVDEYAARLKWKRVAQAGYLGVFRR